MSIAYNPRPVNKGLYCHLDATNIKSYPGSGSTVYDISGNGKNGSFGGGTAWSSADGGRFEFNGINSTINLGAPSSGFFPAHEFAIELWFRSTGTTATTGTNPGLFGCTYGMRCFCYNANLSCSVNVNPIEGSSSQTGFDTPSTFNFYNGNWNHAFWQVRGTEASIFVNGVVQNRVSLGYYEGTTLWPTNGFSIGRDNNNSMYYFTGSISMVKVYKSYFRDDEVKQNFNATKGRYGL